MHPQFLAAGALAGGIVLPVFTGAYHWLFFRSALGDGQYGIVFLVTAPAGALLGAVTGRACFLWWRLGLEAASGRTCILGGGVLAVLFLGLGWFVLSGTDNPSEVDRLTSVLFWFAPALLWAGGLLAAGARLLSASPS